MSDVLKIALERRSALQTEITKIDEFIRMAETLLNATPDQPAHAAADISIRQSRVTGTNELENQRSPAEESFSAPNRPQVIRRNQAV